MEQQFEFLHRMEGIYGKHLVDLTSYGGETLNGFLYVYESPFGDREWPASTRYMDLLVKGEEKEEIKGFYAMILGGNLFELTTISNWTYNT